METETKNKLEEMDSKLDAIYKSAEKTRKYFLAVFWITIILFILPLIGMLFAVRAFLSGYANALGV